MSKTAQAKKTQDKVTQNKVAITVAENGQEIISASESVKKAYEVQKNSIVKCMDNVKGSYLKIGLALVKIHKGNMYVLDGYKNITEFAEKIFGLPRATTNNSMNIVNKFCKEGTATLLDEYIGYNFTQLVEMLPMSDDMLSKVELTMSAAQMRELKKSAKEIKKKDVSSTEHDTIEDGDDEQSNERETQASNIIEIKRCDIANALNFLLSPKDTFLDDDQYAFAKEMLSKFNDTTKTIKIV